MCFLSFYQGDGIGIKLTSYCYNLAKELIKHGNVDIKIELVKSIKDYKELSEYYKDVRRRKGIIISGPIDGSHINCLRKDLDLLTKFIEIKPYTYSSSYSPLKNSLINNVNLLIVRENLDGSYFTKFKRNNDVIEGNVSYSINNIKKVSKIAFELAKTRKNKITIIRKKGTSGLLSDIWQDSFNKLTWKNNVSIEFENLDYFLSEVIVNPLKYDIILTPNLEGDAISDILVQCFQGNRKIGHSINANSELDFFVTQTVHGAAYDIMDSEEINPLGHIYATSSALEIAGFPDVAKRINRTIEDILSSKHKFSLETDCKWNISEFFRLLHHNLL